MVRLHYDPQFEIFLALLYNFLMQLRKIYDDQISYLEKNDLEGLLTQYTEDAVLVRFDKTIRGKENLRTFFAQYLQSLGTFQLISTDKYTEIDDAIFFEATVESQHGRVRVYDVFMIQEGKITHHFAGVIS